MKYAMLLKSTHPDSQSDFDIISKHLSLSGFTDVVTIEPRGRVKTLEAITSAVDLRQFRTPVVFYSGHGLYGMICPHPKYSVTYSELACVLPSGPLLFVNNCCHSGSAVRAFTIEGFLPSNGLILASSRPRQLTYGSYFLDAVLEDFSAGKKFERTLVGKKRGATRSDTVHGKSLGIVKTHSYNPVRAGADLDYLLFPS